MSSPPGIVKFWHLDVYPNCFESVLFWGNVLLSLFFFWLLTCGKRTHQITDSMSRPLEFILLCEMVGHSIVFILWVYFVLRKNQFNSEILALYVYYFFMGGFSHIYSQFNFNSWYFHWYSLDHSHCSAFRQCTKPDRSPFEV